MKNNKKGNVALYISFLVVGIIIVIIAGVFAPLGVQINTEFFRAGEGILNETQDGLTGIQDASVRESINATIISAKANTVNNIEVNSGIFQYAWVLMVIIAGLMAFLFTRQLVEIGGSRGGLV